MGRSTTSSGNPLNTNSRARPTAKNIDRSEVERKALELRRQGCSFDSIAVHLGYSDRSAAYKVVKEAMDRMVREPADELRMLEAQRLDELQQAIWKQALSGDMKAIGTALSIIDRRMRLLGLEAPKRVDVDLSAAVDPGDIEIVQKIHQWRADRLE